MTVTDIVIGTVGDAASDDAAALGIALARTLGAVPVLAHIRPESWQAPGSGRVDAEWDSYLEESTAEILDQTWARHAEALAALGGAVEVGRHRSSGVGLDELAVRRGADYLVIGSAPDGRPGRIAGGSTSERLLHGASVGVAIAPTGYAAVAPERIDRVVVAVDTTAHHSQLGSILDLVHTHGVALSLVTIVRRATRIYSTKLGPTAESDVIRVLRDDAAASLARTLDTVAARGLEGADAQVLVGDDVGAALATYDWRPGDLLACGSRRSGPLRRVLLGDMTFRILRGATVPVLVLPRAEA